MEGSTANLQIDTVELFRSGNPVSSFLSAFGRGLRETRLTTSLGYLLSRSPESFRRLFKFRGDVLNIQLERRQEKDRTDIEIKTDIGNYVIEAKRGRKDPYNQASRYPGSSRILLTQYMPRASEVKRKGYVYVKWDAVAVILKMLSASNESSVRFISRDLLKYMEEHRMIKKKRQFEIYAREINDEDNLLLFLKGQMYWCDFVKNQKLGDALYFAPHFGKSISRKHPGVRQGISYVAKISDVSVVESWQDVLSVLASNRKKSWVKKHALYFTFLRKLKWKKQRRYLILLDSPRLVFNPPIKKESIQGGSGWLSKNYLTFDDFFQAWEI